jgi:CheY-like chemotaxis protein
MMSDAALDILIVEDEAIIALYTRKVVEMAGHRTVACLASGEEVLERLDAAGAGLPDLILPDLILMDIRLAGRLNGIETVQRVRERYGEIPVIYLTAYSDEATRDRALATRCLAFLCKPVEPKELLRAIAGAADHKDRKDRPSGA